MGLRLIVKVGRLTVLSTTAYRQVDRLFLHSLVD